MALHVLAAGAGPVTGSMTTIETATTVTSVEAAAWNRLAGSNVMVTHGFLKAMEEAWIEEVGRVYFLARGPDRLEAAAVCQVHGCESTTESIDDLLLGRLGPALAHLGFSFRPALVCGLPWTNGSGCLTEPNLDPSRKDEVLGLLVDAIEREADRTHRLLAFLSVTDDETLLMRRLRQRGYARADHEPLYFMDLEWESFEAYRSGLPSRNVRRGIRRELNQNHKRGVVVTELEELSTCEDRLHELADRHFRRYGWPAFPYDRTWLGRIRRNLGPAAAIAVARKDDDIVGVAVSVRSHGTCYPFLTCVDHDMSGNDFTFFNLSCYRPIAESIRNGDRRLVSGPGQHRTKSRRGFKPLATHLYCRAPQAVRQLGLRLWCTVLSWWIRRKTQRGRCPQPE